MINVIGAGGTMWVYSGFNMAGFVFCTSCCPTSPGGAFEEIETKLHRGRFRPRDFAR